MSAVTRDTTLNDMDAPRLISSRAKDKMFVEKTTELIHRHESAASRHIEERQTGATGAGFDGALRHCGRKK